jgi:uncharacterized protein (TIGR03067 family)
VERVEDPEIAMTLTILFQNDKFIVVDRDGNRQQERFKLMPDQNPKAIDCWSRNGGGHAAPGIYFLQGDTFKWCSAGGGNKVRPTSFASTPGSKQSLLVLRREKTEAIPVANARSSEVYANGNANFVCHSRDSLVLRSAD